MFTKLFASITESSLWSEPKEVRLLFVTMLAKADQTGFVEASIPGLARVANLTIEETQTGLECLSSPDVYSKNPDNEGRRILAVPGGFMLLNYEEYRERRSTEERREYMRDYMKDYRKRSKPGVNKSKPTLADVSHGKPSLAQAETETETETETEAEEKKKEKTPLSKLLDSAVKEWIAYKAEKGQRYKPTGLKSLITRVGNVAKNYGEDAVVTAMERAMASGWQGWDHDIEKLTPAPASRVMTPAELADYSANGDAERFLR